MQMFMETHAAATNVSQSFSPKYITGQTVFVCGSDLFVNYRDRDRLCEENAHSETQTLVPPSCSGVA